MASVDLKQKAEDDYVYKVQGALRERVWNADCASVRMASFSRNMLSIKADVLRSGTSTRRSGTPCLIRGPNSIIGTAVRFQCGPIGTSRCVF